MLLGIDIGRSGIKIAGPGFRRLLPAGLEPGWRWNGTVLPEDENPDIRIACGGRRYTLSDGPEAVFERSARKTSVRTAITLLAAAAYALHRNPGDDHVSIVTGLPVALAEYDAPELGKTIDDVLESGFEAHIGDASIRLHRRNVSIRFVAEGDGVFAGYVELRGDPPEFTTVADIGHITTNITVYAGYRRVRTRTVGVGGVLLFDRLEREIPGRFRTHIPDRFFLTAMVAAYADARPIPAGFAPQDEVRRVIAAAAERVWEDRILPEIETDITGFSDLVFSGGGSAVFPVRRDFAGAHIPVEPRFAQAKGYLFIASRVGEENVAGVR